MFAIVMEIASDLYKLKDDPNVQKLVDDIKAAIAAFKAGQTG